MGWIAPVLTGLTGLAGLFGKSKQTSDTNSTTTTTPNYDAQTGGFKDYLMSLYKSNLSNLPTQDQFNIAGLKNILGTSQLANQATDSILASRGLSRTTAGASEGTDAAYRQGSIVSDFLTKSPFNYQAALQPSLSGAASFLSSLPIGTTQTSNSHTVGSGGPSSPLAGLISGGAQGLATYLGQQSSANSFANVLKQLGINNSNAATPTFV